MVTKEDLTITNLFSAAMPLVEDMHDKSFFLPDVNSKLMISRKIAVANGRIIGACFSRLTAEGILVMNQELPKTLRAMAAKELIDVLKAEGKKVGLDDCHVFVKNPGVQKFLKHLGFQECQGGQPMVVFL